MSKPLFIDGHYTNASGLTFYQDNFDAEQRQRLLSLIDTFGVVSGYGFSDVSSPDNPSIRISRGLAFDGTGRMIRLTQTDVNAGISTLTGLTSSDLNKIMVVENTVSGVSPEAHPQTGIISDTKELDRPSFSLIASGAIDTSKHIRIGRIYQVIEGVGAHVGASLDTRDVLSFPTSSPFVVVGPTGDTVADYTGDDSEPFNDAINSIKSSTNGGVIAVRPGTYDIDPSDPITVTSLDAIRFVGMGNGTLIRRESGTGSGPTDYQIEVESCEEVTFENISFGDSANHLGTIMKVQDVEKFNFRNNWINAASGAGYNNYGVVFISGVSWVNVDNNWIDGAYNYPYFNCRGDTLGSVNFFSMKNNYFGSGGKMHADGGMNYFMFTGNQMENDAELSIGYDFMFLGTIRSQPKRVIVTHNTFGPGLRSPAPIQQDWSIVNCASGAIITNNAFHKGGSWQSYAIFNTSVGTHAGDYSVIANNTFLDTYSGLAGAPVYVGTADGVIVRANIFVYPAGGRNAPAVRLATTSSNCLVDGNVSYGYTAGSAYYDEGTDNFMTGNVNQTSNKAL